MFLAILALLALSSTLSAQNWDYYESKKVKPKPTFMGGDIKEFKDWVESHLTPLSKYNNLEGIETMTFSISPDGHVKASDNVENVSEYERQLRKELVRVINSAPQWEPGLRRGKPIYVQCKTSFVFPVSYEGMKTPPSFNGGGLNKFAEWVQGEIVYSSDIVKTKGKLGTVWVRFLIEKDGRVTNVNIDSGCDPELDNQILRIVSSSPQWSSFNIPNCKKVAVSIGIKARYGDASVLLQKEEAERLARQKKEEAERLAQQKREELRRAAQANKTELERWLENTSWVYRNGDDNLGMYISLFFLEAKGRVSISGITTVLGQNEHTKTVYCDYETTGNNSIRIYEKVYNEKGDLVVSPYDYVLEERDGRYVLIDKARNRTFKPSL